MRAKLLIPVTSLLGASILEAEPPVPPASVEEQFIGSNQTAYAILRTETESTPDRSGRRSRTWLDEYAKEPVLLYDKLRTEAERIRYGGYSSKLTRSVLLLDVTHGKRPPGKADPEDNELANPVVHSREDSPAISELLLRYPNRSLTPWSSEQLQDLRASESSLFVHYKNQTLVSGYGIRAHMGGVGVGDAKVKRMLGARSVIAVAEDENCVFLTISAATDKRKQTRIFCMIPVLTENIHALQSREELYLTTSRTEHKAEALRLAEELRKKLNESEFATTGIEVWEYASPKYLPRLFYYVAITNSAEIIRDRRVEALQEALGASLLPMPSDSFAILLRELPKPSGP